MKNRIDLRLIFISGFIALVSLSVAWAAIILFRYFFPQLAAETIWDELAGLPIAALISFGVKYILVREQLFHLLVTMDVDGISIVNLKLLRRRDGVGVLFMPTLFKEAIIYNQDTLVRNISWWGVYGVDVCRLCFYADNNQQEYGSLEIPGSLVHSYASVHVKLSELSEGSPLIVDQRHVT